MTLIVGIQAAQGMVLAADSLIREGDAVFDTARKLFTLRSQSHLAEACCGLMSGQLIPVSTVVEALDAQLLQEGRGRLPVGEFAALPSEGLLAVWQATMPAEAGELATEVVVVGIDEGARYGEIWTFRVPTRPEPERMESEEWHFAMNYWGEGARALRVMLEPFDFPFRFMPLQSCAELAEFAISSIAQLQGWSQNPQRVGGPVDVVTIAHAEGVRWVRQKAFWRADQYS